MKVCQKCGDQNGDQSRVCCNCSASLKGSRRVLTRTDKRVAGGLLGLAVICIAAVIFVVSANGADTGVVSPSTSVTTALPSPGGTTAPIAVSAADLHAQYEENELAADKIYKDKIVEVSGTFDRLSITLGQIQVWLTDGGEWSLIDVCCVFDEKYSDQVSALKTGDVITVQGICGGQALSVSITDCVRVK